MHKYPEETPRDGEIVIAYTSGKRYICRYEKALTWTGRKHKFINLTSKGFWVDDVEGWNRLPSKDETL